MYKKEHSAHDVYESIKTSQRSHAIKSATRHIVDTQSKAIQRKEAKKHAKLNKETGGDDNVVVLNSNKRDRRTLEQIQKDLEGESENDIVINDTTTTEIYTEKIVGSVR